MENMEMLLKVIIKKINGLEEKQEDTKEFVKQLAAFNRTVFIPFDPTEYIKEDLSKFKKVYKYQGNLYELKDLYTQLKRDAAIDVERAWFIRHATKQETEYFWGLRVNIVYLASMSLDNGRTYYISTDGRFYKSNLEEIPVYGEYRNAARIMENGRYLVFYAGEYVMFKFVDPDYPSSKVFFVDGDFSNCRIDNIEKLT